MHLLNQRFSTLQPPNENKLNDSYDIVLRSVLTVIHLIEKHISIKWKNEPMHIKSHYI